MIAGPVLFVLALVGLFAYLEPQRTEAMRAECARRGWTYRRDDPSLVDRWTQGPFGNGHGRRVG